jgi:hypothetical protein
MEGNVSVLAYFRSPFPSSKGFSAYRMPGIAVHGPLFFAFLFVGLFLCGPHAVLRPFLIVWILAGLYLGRDIAIYCHYAPLLTLLSWTAAGAVFIKPAPIARFGASHPVVSATLSALLAALLIFVAVWRTREMGEEKY